MSQGFTRFMRDVLGRNARVFVDLLCAQADAAIEAATLLADAAGEGSPSREVAERLARIEGEGDGHRTELIGELSKALTTPIDREDLFRLSRSIDDVLDYLRDFADELVMFQLDDTTLFREALLELRKGLSQLRLAVTALADEPSAVARLAREAKHAAKVHTAYQRAVLELLSGEVSTEMLRARELLRRLDVAGLRLNEAADALSDAALKRG